MQWLDLKPIFRRGWYGGGIASSPVLQEGRAPISAGLCGIFQTLQEMKVGGGREDPKGTIKLHPSTPPSFIRLPLDPTSHLEEGVPICAAELEQGVEWDANNGGQSHEEANGHCPAWILVVVVGDGPVLDHREDENELQRAGDGSGHEAHPAPPRPQASYQYPLPSFPVSQTRKRNTGESRANVSVWVVEKADETKGPGHDGQLAVEGERSLP